MLLIRCIMLLKFISITIAISCNTFIYNFLIIQFIIILTLIPRLFAESPLSLPVLGDLVNTNIITTNIIWLFQV